MNINLKNYTIPLFIALLALQSCKDIIEPSINNKAVMLNAPGDGYKSTSYSVSFWWEPVDEALTYRLQVVSPGFPNIAYLALDTVVKSTTFTINLKPGDYQWHVMALNGSSQTLYSPAKSFTVVPSSIRDQAVQLTSPVNNLLTNQSPFTFQWGDLYGATKYQLQIDTNNFIDESKVVDDQTIPGLQISFTFPRDKTYQWRVRAQNDTAKAKWSAVNTITYDHTPPAQVIATAPLNNKTIATPVALQWNSVSSASKYKLYVFKSDSVTTYNFSSPAVINTNTYNFTLGNSGERVYWKVSAIDAAGNEGTASVLRSFVLQ